jgi:hypothetical protein
MFLVLDNTGNSIGASTLLGFTPLDLENCEDIAFRLNTTDRLTRADLGEGMFIERVAAL